MLLAKQRELTDSYARADADRQRAEERVAEIRQQFMDLISAGRLFEVKIEAPDFAQRPLALPASENQVATFDTGAETSIREIVLDQLKMAGKKGVKASTIRRVVESTLGRQIHYKTIGMTLYRLSEKSPPQARREGFIWFAV